MTVPSSLVVIWPERCESVAAIAREGAGERADALRTLDTYHHHLCPEHGQRGRQVFAVGETYEEGKRLLELRDLFFGEGVSLSETSQYGQFCHGFIPIASA